MRQKRAEKRNQLWRKLLGVVMAVAMLLPFAYLQPASAAATGTEEVSIQVTYGQTQARKLLTWINDFREKVNDDAKAAASGAAIQNKLPALNYDYSLEQIAMQRAAEVALVYDAQSRPNGTPVTSLYADSNIVENISCMGSTAVQVGSAWKDNPNSSDYGNLVDPGWTAVGVGHVSYNGNDYWVAAFSDKLSGMGVLPESNGSVTQTIEIESARILNRSITGAPTGSISMNVGDYYDLGKCKASIQVKGHYPLSEYCPLVGSVSAAVMDPSIVSFNGSSLYGAGAGSTSVTLTCGGLTAAPFTVAVQKPSISQATIDTITDQSYTGYEIRPSVKVRIGSTLLTENIDYTLKFENNVNIGTAYVTVTGYGKYAGTGSKSTSFRIVAPNVSNATITTIPDQYYTGYAICPALTVYVNNIVLREGVDYTASYYNNVNIGTATVNINGIGSYSGMRTATFRITGPNLYNATIASIPDQLYTGSDIRPTVTVTVNNITLQPNTDYYVSYSNNRNMGTATVTVTGRGNYSGSKTANFRIIGKDLSNATVNSIGTQRYTGDEIRPDVTVKLGSITLQQNADYKLTYSDNIRPGKASILISGMGAYNGSKTLYFKIAQASLSSASVKIADQTYNGEEKTPSVTVKLDGETLREDEDYEVEYLNNEKPGKATAVITGIGDYSGTKKGYFVIKPQKMKLLSVKATTYKGTKAVKLSWKKDSNVKGYEVHYSKKKSSGYKSAGTLSKNSNVTCIHKRRPAGTYYYKVRSYILVDGKKCYSAFSGSKKVTVK